MKFSLLSKMHIGDSRIITFVGAGGKTSLMYALGKEMSLHHKTLLTTTTHIMEPRDLPGVRLVTKENQEQLVTAFQNSRLVALGIPLSGADRRTTSGDPGFLSNISAGQNAAPVPKWASPSSLFWNRSMLSLNGFSAREMAPGGFRSKFPGRANRFFIPVQIR